MADENTEQPQQKKSSSTLLIIIIAMGIIIGVGGALGFIMLKSESPDRPAQEERTEDRRRPAPETMGPVLMLEPFIVNLSGSGLNYLKVEMGLELSNTEVEKEIASKKPQIQDSIILLLSTKSFEEIRTGQGKLVLKDELMARLNNILRTGTVRNIYFTSFIVQ